METPHEHPPTTNHLCGAAAISTHDEAAVHSIRAALKVLLRRFGLRCVSIEEKERLK
jgi:hypothetical protein